MATKLQNELRDIANRSQAEAPILLGVLLARLFQEKKVLFTIVGGAAVQFYTQAEYTTCDLDVILQGDSTEIIEDVMGSLGFKRTSTYRHFEHPLFNFVVEFPPSPIEVGGRHISKVSEIQTDLGVVRVIRIEDIIMDRIIAGVEWRSQESLDQARLLWIKNRERIDLEYLTEFARQEGYAKTLEAVVGSSKKAKKNRPARHAV